MKIIVVGGVAGGATAIARIRRLDEQAEIVLIERGKYVSFANCGLPYYVGGVIPQREALFVSSKEDLEDKYGLEIRTEEEVIEIDREKKQVVIRKKDGTSYRDSYDKLLLSTGSHPFVPPVKGLDAPGVFTLWTVPDADKINRYIDEHQPQKAVVVGGGFIGLEMAENLVEHGIQTSIVEMAPQVMPPLDKDMAKLVENHLVEKGIQLYLEKGFAGMAEDGKRVLLNDGSSLASDLTLLSIGVRPNSELAKKAGLELNQRGGIVVDQYMQTSDPDIYAVGDVIQVKDFVTGVDTMIPLAGPANKQGRSVAQAITGQGQTPYLGSLGTSSAKIFDLTVAATGANEKTLERQGKVYGKDYFLSLLHPMSHAGYYPGAQPMTLKLLFAKDGKVLGAQIVGFQGVDKRIDTISTSMHFHGTVDDLANLELAYAPPYSSAKDPVNFAGFIGQNVLEGKTDPVLYREWMENPEKYQLLDVREDPEVIAGMLPGAKHIPLSRLRKNLDQLDPNTLYLAYCQVGLRGYLAERILRQHGFQVKNLAGGYSTVMDMKMDTSPKAAGNDGAAGAGLAGAGASATAGSGAAGAAKAVAWANASPASQQVAHTVDLLNVCGMSCPGPIVQVSKAMDKLQDGDILEVLASDPGFTRDIDAWAKNTGNTLLSRSSDKGQYKAKLQKGLGQAGEASVANAPSADLAQRPTAPLVKEKTMIIFDGDLDRAIASFIIANGAAAMGNKVHMFFTFWGLSILRKPNPPKLAKSGIQKMFSAMLPKGSQKLKLSHFHFAGMGSKMIRGLMHKHGVPQLEELIQQAMENGVQMTACQMSMDLMGIQKEELIDGVEVGGVASMLADNDRSNMNLFI